MPDAQLGYLLRDRRIGVHQLTLDGVPAGFYELDGLAWPHVNLSYFGLLPHAVGQHLGHAFLRHAVDAAWAGGARVLTVNTCSADHPRALPTYLRVGFRRFARCRRSGTSRAVSAWSFRRRCAVKSRRRVGQRC